MIALTYFYIFVIVLCWTLNPFIKKQVMKKMDPNEYLIMNHSVVTIILVFYLVYLLKKKKYIQLDLDPFPESLGILMAMGT